VIKINVQPASLLRICMHYAGTDILCHKIAESWRMTEVTETGVLECRQYSARAANFYWQLTRMILKKRLEPRRKDFLHAAERGSEYDDRLVAACNIEISRPAAVDRAGIANLTSNL
jgi:hypothetical protein